MEFHLVRLILIDSYSPGRVVEFPLDGGAVLTGRNGRGKTTLLLPIFCGENPTRIVGTETNRLDFNTFYRGQWGHRAIGQWGQVYHCTQVSLGHRSLGGTRAKRSSDRVQRPGYLRRSG